MPAAAAFHPEPALHSQQDQQHGPDIHPEDPQASWDAPTSGPTASPSPPDPVSVNAHRSAASRAGSMTPAQAKAFLRQGVVAMSPPPAYTSSSQTQLDPSSKHSTAANNTNQEDFCAPADSDVPTLSPALEGRIANARSADTPFSSPSRSPTPSSQRKPRTLQSPPTSMPMGMKERGGPEPDSADWAKLNHRCDPIQIRDRYQNPVHLERTILSPAISEASEQTTRPSSFRTQSSIASLHHPSSHRPLPPPNPSTDGSDDGTLSAFSNSTARSAASAPLLYGPDTFSAQGSDADPSHFPRYEGQVQPHAPHHRRGPYNQPASTLLDRMNADSRSRSDPALRQVHTVPSVASHQRPKSRQALIETTAASDEEEDLHSDPNVHLSGQFNNFETSVPFRSSSGRKRTSKRNQARQQQRQKEAEERFARQLQARERYMDRKEMITEKQTLVRNLNATSDPLQQSYILRDLGEISLTSAMDLAAAGSTQTEGYKKVSENAVVCMRQALERQIPLAQQHPQQEEQHQELFEQGSSTGHPCTAEDVSETWYLLGRAHEALSYGIDPPEGLAQRQYALASYGHALEATRNPTRLGRIWCSLGVLQCSLQNYAASRDAFDRAVQEDSRQLRAWLNLGQLWETWFFTQGTEEERAVALRKARNSYFRAVRLDPTDEAAQARLEALGGPPEELSYTTSMSGSSFTESASNAGGHSDIEEDAANQHGTASYVSDGEGPRDTALDASNFEATLPTGILSPAHVHSSAQCSHHLSYDEEAEDQHKLNRTSSITSLTAFDASATHSTPMSPSHAPPHPSSPLQPPQMQSDETSSDQSLSHQIYAQHPDSGSDAARLLPVNTRDLSLEPLIARLDSIDSRISGLTLEYQVESAPLTQLVDSIHNLSRRVNAVVSEQQKLSDVIQHLSRSQVLSFSTERADAAIPVPPRPSTAPAGVPQHVHRPDTTPSFASRGQVASHLLRQLGGEARFGRTTMLLSDVASSGQQGAEIDEDFLFALLQQLGALRLADFATPST